MQKKYLPLLLLSLSGCIIPTAYPIHVEEDKFKGETYLCSQTINEYRTTIYYKICRAKIMDGSHKDFIYGSVEYASPIPLEYNEAIDANREKLKIKSKDDRRLGMTINEFVVTLPKDYISKNDSIGIKIYGVSHNFVATVSTEIITALREKIKEMEGNQIKK